MALLRSVDGEFIAGALVSAALCEVVDAVFVACAGARNFIEVARSAPTRSRAAKVASGICAII